MAETTETPETTETTTRRKPGPKPKAERVPVHGARDIERARAWYAGLAEEFTALRDGRETRSLDADLQVGLYNALALPEDEAREALKEFATKLREAL